MTKFNIAQRIGWCMFLSFFITWFTAPIDVEQHIEYYLLMSVFGFISLFTLIYGSYLRLLDNQVIIAEQNKKILEVGAENQQMLELICNHHRIDTRYLVIS